MLSEVLALLTSQNVTSAVIVDDLYDPVPTLAHVPREAWTFFFDDLGDSERALIEKGFPGRNVDDWESLSNDEVFLRYVWSQRTESAVFAKLFGHFESETQKGKKSLDKLEAFLRDTLKLTTNTAGSLGASGAGVKAADAEEAGDAPLLEDDLERSAAGTKSVEGEGAPVAPTGLTSAPNPEDTADIVFMDLFLGAEQDKDALGRAVERVRGLVARRRKQPPLVVLMSSSTRLKKHADDFRDQALLLGCQFRMLEKAEIDQQERLLDLVFRLVARYKDTLRLAGFVDTWSRALAGASQRLLRRIRRLDLRDYANLHALVLEAEGERVGGYLVELYDRVFHYELEGDKGLVAAAENVNKIEWTEYPPPHFLPMADAMDILDNLMFHHASSLSAADPVTFGDVLFWKQKGDAAKLQVPATDVSKREILALFVLTQACDLQRGGVGRLFFMPGIARPVDLRHHRRPGDKMWTPVLKVGDETFVVNWKLEVGPFTCTEAELAARLGSGEYKRVRRFRTVYALQLQQEFASNLTRVGTMAVPPVRHAVALKVFFRAKDQTLTQLMDLPDSPEQAVALVGRDSGGLVDQLALSPAAVERLRAAMLAVDLALVDGLAKGEPQKWRDALARGAVLRSFEHGVEYGRDKKERPFKGQDDIAEIVGPFFEKAPALDQKWPSPGPLVVQVLLPTRPEPEPEGKGGDGDATPSGPEKMAAEPNDNHDTGVSGAISSGPDVSSLEPRLQEKVLKTIESMKAQRQDVQSQPGGHADGDKK